ncbi:MAG TPA: hypothetical protein VGX03_15395 [Candidatus Binatia bacterium]|nr:hypothetical protein [Candidatus Binatia bacterium]
MTMPFERIRKGRLYFGPEELSSHSELRNLLQLHENLEQERIGAHVINLQIPKGLFSGMAKKLREQEERREKYKE